MALDDQELQEQLFEDIGEIKDVLNLHSQGFVAISATLGEVLTAVTKETEGDSLYTVLRDIHAAIERSNALMAAVAVHLNRT